MKARQQFDVAGRGRRVVSRQLHAHFLIGRHKLRPLRLKLILCLLLVVRALLYRCVQTYIRVDDGSAVDFAPPFNVEGWNIIRNRDDHL